MKKLYRVTVSFVMYVMAKNSIDAREVAEDNCREELDNGNADISPGLLVHTLNTVDDEWRSCIPWGADNEKTIYEILDFGKLDD
jgi:hypothetical protein